MTAEQSERFGLWMFAVCLLIDLTVALVVLL